MRLVAKCPAKVNLVLRVLGPRSDGYHELETVFQAVALWDTLEAELADDLALTVEPAGVPDDHRNLVLRAARLFQRFSGTRSGARFRLRKEIPVGGGMGGGSSDAAGALVLLDRLWSVGAGAADLLRLAGSIGADAPFFLVGGTALGRGRGEVVTRLPDLPEAPLMLAIPPFGIPTAEVYRRLRSRAGHERATPQPLAGHDGTEPDGQPRGQPPSRLTPPSNSVSVARSSTLKLPGGNDFGFVANDLEEVVFEGWPELRAFRDAALGAGALQAALSGSGSTVFGIFRETVEVRHAISILRKRFGAWDLKPCRTIREGVSVRIHTDDVG
jgi:4-diphosphocytidyl-2-C-methyl-D-erythritol kinase